MLGLYPTWFEPGVGSGWIIGFIATIHVLFSHASVGGGILFAWLANYAVRKDRPVYLSFIRRYGLFLLIFSYVLGSITGPGIWFAATVASPRGISALIHSFVWLWASEWVFFLIEVVGVYLLVYLAGRVDPKTHTRIATIFGLSSVATLLVIAGILSFMLWPGQADWHQTGGVLNAFFGENTFAQVAARFMFMLTITGVVGGIVAGRIRDADDRRAIVRILSAAGLIGTFFGCLAFNWYLSTIPAEAHDLAATRLPEQFGLMMAASVAVSAAYFIITAWKPAVLRPWLAGVMTIVILVLGLAPEETAREIIRKPWVAGQYVYGNQIIGRDVPALGIKSELPRMAEKGILAQHPFVPESLRRVTPENEVAAGRVLALTLCSNCHSLTSTGIRPLERFFPSDADRRFIADYLGAGLHRGHTVYMPAVPLPEAEREAMAAYIETLVKKGDAK